MAKGSESTTRQLLTHFWVAVIAVAAAAVAGLILHILLPLNRDVGLSVYEAQVILERGDLYRNVYEVNPPFYYYALAGMLALTRQFSISDMYAVCVGSSAFIIACSGFFAFIIHRARLFRHASSPMQLLLCLVVFNFCVFTGEFAQRDQLILNALLPYSAVTHFLGRRANISFSARMTSALLCAAALCMKPQYVFVIACLESLLAIRMRTVAALFRIENQVIAVVGSVYLLTIWFFEPTYYTLIIPLAAQTYADYGLPLNRSHWTLLVLLVSLALLLTRFLEITDEPKSLIVTLLVASIASFAVFLRQAHFQYQQFPFVGFGLMASGLAVVSKLDQNEKQSFKRHLPFAAGLFFCSIFIGSQYLDTRVAQSLVTKYNCGDWKIRPRLDDVDPYLGEFVGGIRGRVNCGTIYCFSSNVFVSFPAILYAGSRWNCRFQALWPLPAAVRMEAAAKNDPNVPVPTIQGMPVSEFVVQTINEDFEREMPKLVLVDLSPIKSYFPKEIPAGRQTNFDYLEFFSRSERFRLIWKNYRFDGYLNRTPDREFAVYRLAE